MSHRKQNSRRSFLQTALVGGVAATLATVRPALSAVRAASRASGDTPQPNTPANGAKPFELEEVSLAELQEGMKSGKFTARSLVERYTARIFEIDKLEIAKPGIEKHGPAINSVI